MTRLKNSIVIKIAALVFYFLMAFFLAKAQVTSDFSANADGWTVFDNNTGVSTPATYNASGGNPDGFDSFTTASGALNMYWIAPAKFNGNHSFSYNQTLSFDLNVSLDGLDNSIGDVELTNASTGLTLYFQLPANPLANQWNSYSIQLNESFWHSSSPTGPAATLNQMKQVLVNLSKLQIRAKYTTANTGPYVVSIDNVILNTKTLAAPPVIASFTPQSAKPGASVTITGANFNATVSQNYVYFNGVRAVPSSSTATQLVVTVPPGAAYGQIIAENLVTGLQGASALSFNALYDNNKDFGGQIIPASMAQGYKAILAMSNSGNTYSSMDKGDLDGDGWVDLVTSETFSTSIYVFRNLGTGGSVSTSSFSTGTLLTGLSLIPGGSPNLGPLTVADVDNDGRPDIAAVTSSASGGFLAVFQNTSSSGNISFASPKFFAYPYYSSQLFMTSGDLDGDGRIDFLYTTGTSPGGIWVNQNMSTPGNIDFAYGVAIGTSLGHTDIMVGDLNADAKPEVIAGTGAAAEIYQNTSVAGAITVNAPFSVTTTSGSYFAMADLDADNKSDLFWSAYGAQYIYLAKNNYAGATFDATSFGAQIAISCKLGNPSGFNISDINSDGKPDIVIVGSSDIGIMENVGATGALNANSFLSPTLFQGSATGQFLYGLGPVVADLDGDNKPEVAFVYSNSSVTTAEKGIYIFHNESYPAPRIDTMTPAAGVLGSNISFAGDHFSTGPGFPPVYARLGKIPTVIVPSSNTSASGVVTPSTSGRFTFTEHGLTAYSKLFSVLFSTNQTINSSSFGPSVDFALAINPRDALDVADFDDDGKVDISVIHNGFTKIFRNTQATAGQPITTSSLVQESTTYPSGFNLIALDIDGDGKTDLNSGGGLLQNTSSGSISFTSVTSSAGGFTTSSSADFNKDGKTDLAFTNGSINVQVFENLSCNGPFTPSGTFQNFGGGAINLAAPSAPGSVVAADFDGDGYDDIISMNPNTNNSSYFLNNKIYGRLSVSSFSFLGNYGTTGLQPYDVTANDFDGDGKTDIAITYFNSAFVSVLLNNSVLGNISFTGTDVPVANKGYKITSQDLDGDGKAEIVVIHQPNPGPGSFTVLQNKCTAGVVSFTTTNFPITRNPQAINLADVNSDQKPDILIVASSGTVGNALIVFENKISPPPPTITNFSPASGPIGTTVSITGTNFDTTPSNNIVKFNGTATVVTASTATSITTIVPAGATTGTITVTVGVSTATSAGSFTITSHVPLGNVVQMNGTTDYIEVQDNAAVRPTNLTLEAWVNFSSVPTFAPIFNKVVGSGISDTYQLFFLNGVLKGTVEDFAGANTFAQVTWTPTIGQWYHIAFTYDDVTRSEALYLDGVVVATNVVAASPQYDNSPLYVGGDRDNGTTYYGFPGKIDEARIWNITRTPTGILSTINTSLTGNETGLAAYYKMDETGQGAGINVVNSASATGAAINGTTFGTPCTPIFTLNPPPTISSFSPTSGVIGATVTMTGSNFDPNPVNNLVLFNGTAATVTASTTGSLTTTVPTGATTGTISVAADCNTAISSSAFTVNTPVITITTQPSDFSVCPGGIATFTTVATGTTNIVYQWQFSATGIAGSFSDIANGSGYSNATTPTLSVNTSGNFGAGRYRCKIDGDLAVTVFTNDEGLFLNSSSCAVPVITAMPLATEVGGKVTLDLKPLITTANLDLSSLQVTSPPSSGAVTSIDANGILTIDYAGKAFAGTELFTIKACDLNGQCSTQNFSIDVSGDIVVFNGISPNGKNPGFIIQFIDALPDTKNNTVYIFDRWENLVWHGSNYDNASVVFTGVSDGGSDLPSGVYFYKIDFASGKKTRTGFISLRRQ